MNIDKGKVGLINRGNTCFFNSSIQILSNIEQLTNYFFTSEYETDILNRLSKDKDTKNINNIILSKEYAKLIKVLWTTGFPSVEPKSLHECIQKFDKTFDGFMQQDAQECMSFVLDALHEGLHYETLIHASGEIENEVDELMVNSIKKWSDIVSNKYSIIVDTFFGQFYIQTFSNDPNYEFGKIVSTKYEIFNILNVQIRGVTLYDCLNSFFGKEPIDGEFELNENQKILAKRKINIIKAPQILVIVLKRFSHHMYKLDNMITFPLNNLNMGPYCIGYDTYETKYKLKSVVLHSGSLNGGHYYSYVNHINTKWYEYNDSSCSEIDINEKRDNLFKNGYILIYEKK